MRKSLLILSLIAAPASAQSTSCYMVGTMLQCDTYGQQQPSAADGLIRQMLSNQGVNGFQQNYQAAQERRQQQQLMQQQIQMQHMQNCEYAEAHGYSIRGC